MTNPTRSTGQKSLGHAVLLLRDINTAPATSFDGGSYLAWIGTDKKLNFSNRKSGESFVSSPIGNSASRTGPALVVMPDEMTAYYIFSDNTGRTDNWGQLGISTLVRQSPSSYDWSVNHTVIMPDSPLLSGSPSAHLGTQNGQLCLNLAWVKRNSDAIQLGQAYLGLPGSAVTFSKPLTLSTRFSRTGASLIRDGKRYILAYFPYAGDTRLRLAPSTNGLFDFPEADDFMVDVSVPSIVQWPVQIVRVNRDLLVVLYTFYEKVLIALLGRAADGKYEVAHRQEIGQAKTDAQPTGRLRWVLKDGLTKQVLTVAWSDITSQEIKYTDIDLELP